MAHSLFAKKTMAQLEAELQGEQRLRRVLGPITLTSLGIGAIIGTGIFVLTGLAAKEFAGPGLMLSFVFAGIGCAFAGLCYAEFASMIPVAGSAYTYAYATLGELMAWVIGWDLILEYAMGSSTVAYGWSKYFAKLMSLFDVKFPIWFANDYWSATALLKEATEKGTTDELLALYSSIEIPSVFGIPFAANFLALFIIAVVTVVLVIGIRESARFNATMVVIKLAVVLFVIFVGSSYINRANWTPFLPFGLAGVMRGAGRIFFAYIGFDSISTHAEEAKNPQRDVPIGILSSLGICTILYILVTAVLTGMVKYDQIDIGAPVASVFSNYGLNIAVFLVSVGAVAGITSVMLVMLLSQPRVFLAMARDGLLPRKVFGVVHPRFRTPHRATILTGTVCGVVAALTPIDILADMVNIGTLLAFVIVCAAVLILRRTHPNQRRPFRTPWVSFVSIAGILANLALMLSLPLDTWARLIIWLVIGLIIYFVYSRKHSVIAEAQGAQAAKQAGS
ncbi:MAG: amino acid permease [Candidatus Latescibacteria bacterium]|nr:amino acid permease [Candidatus Latescibacterota bacterium]